jgi:hypothetical protein
MKLKIGAKYDVAFKPGCHLENGTYTLNRVDFGNWPTGGFYCVLYLSDGTFETGFFSDNIYFMVPHKED